MTITVVFLALLVGTLVAFLIKQSVNVKPWAASVPEGTMELGAENAQPKLLGLVVFMAVATSLFALFASAYFTRMEYPDWRPVPDPDILWWNTGVLLLGSGGLQWAWRSAARNLQAQLFWGLVAGGVCTLAFFAGQLMAWQQLNQAGYFLTANPANSFFYVITAVHGLHLVGGLVAWARTMIRVLKGASPGEVRSTVGLCAVYWHFLMVVWLFLFGLMLAT